MGEDVGPAGGRSDAGPGPESIAAADSLETRMCDFTGGRDIGRSAWRGHSAAWLDRVVVHLLVLASGTSSPWRRTTSTPYLSSRRAWSWVGATMTRRTTCPAGTSIRDSGHQEDDPGKPTTELPSASAHSYGGRRRSVDAYTPRGIVVG